MCSTRVTHIRVRGSKNPWRWSCLTIGSRALLEFRTDLVFCAWLEEGTGEDGRTCWIYRSLWSACGSTSSAWICVDKRIVMDFHWWLWVWSSWLLGRKPHCEDQSFDACNAPQPTQPTRPNQPTNQPTHQPNPTQPNPTNEPINQPTSYHV